MTITIYVEGGGDSKELHSRCREGFRKLIEKCGFQGPMPKIIACGGRSQTFEMFQIAHSNQNGYAILLVDSEEPVSGNDFTPNSSIGWDHLGNTDHWSRPANAHNNQAQMMTTCMESWIMADHQAIRNFYGSCVHEISLFPVQNLETRLRHDVQSQLVHATANCGRKRGYKKGEHSFRLLSSLNPDTLSNHLQNFHRFRQTLGEVITD